MSLYSVFFFMMLGLLPVFASDSLKDDTQDKVVRLASPAVLYEVVKGIVPSPTHFLGKTKLHEELGGQKKSPEGVQMAVTLSIVDYVEDLRTGGMPMNGIVVMMMSLEQRIPRLVQAILDAKD